jgi:hypothetical protein
MKYKKSEIAIIQLKAAIRHYDGGDYISALNLAGASSEIFTSLCKARKLSYKHMLPAEKVEELNRPGINIEKYLKTTLNKNKNEFKHHESDEDYEIEGEFWRDALGFISDTVENYRILFGHDIQDEAVSAFMDKTFKAP